MSKLVLFLFPIHSAYALLRASAPVRSTAEELRPYQSAEDLPVRLKMLPEPSAPPAPIEIPMALAVQTDSGTEDEDGVAGGPIDGACTGESAPIRGGFRYYPGTYVVDYMKDDHRLSRLQQAKNRRDEVKRHGWKKAAKADAQRCLGHTPENAAQAAQRRYREDSLMVRYSIERLADVYGMSIERTSIVREGAIEKFSTGIDKVLLRQRKKKYSPEYVQSKVDIYVESMIDESMKKRDQVRTYLLDNNVMRKVVRKLESSCRYYKPDKPDFVKNLGTEAFSLFGITTDKTAGYPGTTGPSEVWGPARSAEEDVSEYLEALITKGRFIDWQKRHISGKFIEDMLEEYTRDVIREDKKLTETEKFWQNIGNMGKSDRTKYIEQYWRRKVAISEMRKSTYVSEIIKRADSARFVEFARLAYLLNVKSIHANKLSRWAPIFTHPLQLHYPPESYFMEQAARFFEYCDTCDTVTRANAWDVTRIQLDQFLRAFDNLLERFLSEEVNSPNFNLERFLKDNSTALQIDARHV